MDRTSTKKIRKVIEYLNNAIMYTCKICPQMFITALFIGAKTGNNPNVYQLINR